MPPLLPDVPDSATYRRLHGDTGNWLPAARAVADRHGLPLPSAEDWLGGSEPVFGAGPNAVLKFSCPLFRQQFVAERRMLEALAGVPAVGAPRILGEGEIEGWTYLVLGRVGGVTLKRAWPEVPPEEREAVAGDIGRRLALVQGLPAAGVADLYLPWEAFVPRQAATAVERHRRFGVPPEVLEEIPAAVAAAGPLPRPGVAPVPLHADLTDENVHLERVDGRWRVAGILDFGDAMLGDPEYDLMVAAVFVAAGEPAVLRALFRGAGREGDLDDPALPARLTAWMLLHRFGTITPFVGKVPGPAKATLAAGIGPLWRAG